MSFSPAGLSFAALLVASPLLAQNTIDLEARANDALGLERSQLQVLPVISDRLGVQAVLQVESQMLLLDLEPYSVLAPDFKLYEQDASGALHAVQAVPTRTLRGSLIGAPGSVVAGSLEDDGLYARIFLADGQEYWVEPIARLVPEALPEHHVLYALEDVLETNQTCGSDYLPLEYQSAGGVQYGTSGGLSVAELACDADYEYYQDYGSSSGNVQNRITSVINTMNLQYESQVDITHSITAIVVRTSSNDPYSSTDAVTLLNQFRNEWNANQGGISRDVAQLFTGKEINSSTIGIAWVGAVCSTYAYGMVQSDFNNNFSCATDLSAHELGHNWGANHCNCTSFTMNPSITCANSFSSSATIPEIVSFRNSVNCLGGGDPPPPPAEPTSVHVASIGVGQQSAGQGNKYGTATVAIEDDLGNPVAGATVNVTFSGGGGNLNGPSSGVTGSNGSVTILSPGTKKGKISFTVCVTNVSASLPYAAGDNAETCETK